MIYLNSLIFLGKENGFGKNNTSAYTIINNNLLLIDCGNSVFYKIYRMDQERQFLKARNNIEVIITHLHDDHVGSLSQLILYCFYNLNKKVFIYSKCKRLKELLDITGAPVEGYEIVENDKINFIKTNHVNNMDCYGFQTTINNKNIVYTSDTTTLEPFYKYLNYDTDFYVDACYNKNPVHLNIKDNILKLNILANNKVNIFLMHLDDENKIRKLIGNSKIKICNDYSLNKNDIIRILNDYNFDSSKYTVISGAAMVLYGFKDFTKDIDIAVDKDYYKELLNKYNCSFEKVNKDNECIYFIDDIINFGKTYYSKRKNIINDIPVQKIEDLILLKEKLHREKDIIELNKIRQKIK